MEHKHINKDFLFFCEIHQTKISLDKNRDEKWEKLFDKINIKVNAFKTIMIQL